MSEKTTFLDLLNEIVNKLVDYHEKYSNLINSFRDLYLSTMDTIESNSKDSEALQKLKKQNYWFTKNKIILFKTPEIKGLSISENIIQYRGEKINQNICLHNNLIENCTNTIMFKI